MKFDLSYDDRMHKWRLSNPGTGEVRECQSVVPLVVALYQEVSFAAFGQPIPHPEVELYEALSQDLMNFWVTHDECDEELKPADSAGADDNAYGASDKPYEAPVSVTDGEDKPYEADVRLIEAARDVEVS